MQKPDIESHIEPLAESCDDTSSNSPRRAHECSTLAHIDQLVNTPVPPPQVDESSPDATSANNGQATPLVAVTPQELDKVVADVTELMQRQLAKVLGNADAASRAVKCGLEHFLYNIENSRFFSVESVSHRLRHLIRKEAGLEPKKGPRRNKRLAGDKSKTGSHAVDDGIFTFEELTEQIADPQNLERFNRRARKYLDSANDSEAKNVVQTARLIAVERVKKQEVSFRNLPQYCTWLYEAIRRLALARHRSLRVELAELMANRDAEGVEIDFGTIVGQDCESEHVWRNEYMEKRELVREAFGQLLESHQKTLQEEVRRLELDDKSPLSDTQRSARFRARKAARKIFATHNIRDTAFIPANDHCWPIDDDDE